MGEAAEAGCYAKGAVHINQGREARKQLDPGALGRGLWN